jgi:hypothetical protein
MLKPSVLKTISYIAMACCLLCTLFEVYEAYVIRTWILYLMTVSWILLAYASYLGTKLATYDLYEEDRKKLGLYIYGILALFVVFLFFNFAIGILPAIFLAIKLHNQKSGFDSWMRENSES